MSEDRPAARPRDDWRPHHLLVTRAPETETRPDRASQAVAPQEERPGVKKIRLDELLVARGLAESRAQAKALIMTGRVRRGTERLDKPGKDFAEDTELTVDQPPRFVSRGGEKLAAALEQFHLDLRGAHVRDVGATPRETPG
jgi:ribosome-associated protein YbcJ (S4-like RNA binding protein)